MKLVTNGNQILTRRLLALTLLGAAALQLRAAESPLTPITYTEDFSSNPAGSGWKTFGRTDLFAWDEAHGSMRVTWDSRAPNSYFYRPVETILSKSDDFDLAFDLKLEDLQLGINPAKTGTFQIAVGLLELSSATHASFLRGSGTNAWNLVELDYFPDSGFGATVSPTFISSDIQFATGFNSPLELTVNDLFRVVMSYRATNATLTTTMTRNGESFGPIKDTVVPAGFDFRVDSVAVMSYSDEGQDPNWGGSVLAHGVLDNLRLTAPASAAMPLTIIKTDGKWGVEFQSRAGWTYTLQASSVLGAWDSVGSAVSGTGGTLTLLDAREAASASFYRVNLSKP